MYNSHEYRLMYSRSRIAVAELYRFNDSNQSHGDYGFHERVVLRDTACPRLVQVSSQGECCQIKFRAKRI